jgi:hypothetical protein
LAQHYSVQTFLSSLINLNYFSNLEGELFFFYPSLNEKKKPGNLPTLFIVFTAKFSPFFAAQMFGKKNTFSFKICAQKVTKLCIQIKKNLGCTFVNKA